MTDDFEIEISLKKKIKIRKYSYASNPLSLDWSNIFSGYILPNKAEILKNKTMKLEMKHKDCYLIIK